MNVGIQIRSWESSPAGYKEVEVSALKSREDFEEAWTIAQSRFSQDTRPRFMSNVHDFSIVDIGMGGRITPRFVHIMKDGGQVRILVSSERVREPHRFYREIIDFLGGQSHSGDCCELSEDYFDELAVMRGLC